MKKMPGYSFPFKLIYNTGINQITKIKPPIPPVITNRFFLNERPHVAGAEYIWEADKPWGANKIWMG